MKYISKTTRLAALLIVGVLISLNTNAQTFLTNGLVAYYPFNGNANDASGNGHNGTNHGGFWCRTDSAIQIKHIGLTAQTMTIPTRIVS